MLQSHRGAPVVLEQDTPAKPRVGHSGGAGAGHTGGVRAGHASDSGAGHAGGAREGHVHMALQPLATSPGVGWDAPAGAGLCGEETHHSTCRDSP